MESKHKFYQFDYSFAKNGDIMNGKSYQKGLFFDTARAIQHVRAVVAKDDTVTVSISNETEIEEEVYREHNS